MDHLLMDGWVWNSEKERKISQEEKSQMGFTKKAFFKMSSQGKWDWTKQTRLMRGSLVLPELAFFPLTNVSLP